MQRQRQTGFSLLEIMAVLFVIGLSLSMVSLVFSRGGPRDDVWEAIDQFMGLAHFAGERAILSGETMGLLLEPPLWQTERGQSADEVGWRYRWVTDSSQGWQPIHNVDPVSLSPTLRLEVEIDGLPWDYDAHIDQETPIVAVFPSGDISDFRIEFSDTREPSFVQTLAINEEGQLVWLEEEEELSRAF